jgi:alanine-glyoxylate transaminase/serine-glyoxylate transaminase/serine-pyruvate transaminase
MTTRTFAPRRLLLGPGPSPVDDRVMAALAQPPVGHLDPYFIDLMSEIRRLLRLAFKTENEHTLAISGTGTAGMEAALANVLDRDSAIVVGVMGFFGERLAEIAARTGARVIRVDAEWGKPVATSKIVAALDANPDVRTLGLVQAETSTGVLQPLGELVEYLSTREDLVFVLDTVTSLGAHPVAVDENRIDVCYSCSQKALGALPGLAPITFSPRAMARVRARPRPVRSWYFDVSTLERYWGPQPTYHHTAPVSLNYALAEALWQVEAEGLEARYRRHRLNSRAFMAGLKAMGLSILPAPEHRLATLHAVSVPGQVDEARVRRRLLEEFGIEIGAGIGELKGRIWRVGFMGHGSTRSNVLFFLSALQAVLRAEGCPVPPGVDAAEEFYREDALEGAV